MDKINVFASQDIFGMLLKFYAILIVQAYQIRQKLQHKMDKNAIVIIDFNGIQI